MTPETDRAITWLRNLAHQDIAGADGYRLVLEELDRRTPTDDTTSALPDITPATTWSIPNGIYRLTGSGPLAQKNREIRVRTVRTVEMRDALGDWTPLPDTAADRLVARVADGAASWVAAS